MGVKARVNHKVNDDEQKYYYLIPCPMSQTLYGYSQNYNYLSEKDVYIFESEKSVMQCHSYGIRNSVALGSSSLSVTQIKMLLELQPKKIVFMHDKGLDFDVIKKNILLLSKFIRMFEVEIGYWDFTNEDIPNKASLSDLGKERYIYGINNEIKVVTGRMINEWKLQDIK